MERASSVGVPPGRGKVSTVASDARRVIAGVSGSLGNLAALRVAVAEALRAEAVLIPVLAWTPVGGEVAYRRAPCPELLQVWEQTARERLRVAFEAVFGGDPPGLVNRPVVVRAAPGPALVETANRPDDLLVGHRRARPIRPQCPRLGQPLLPGPRPLPRSRRTAT
jgi:hypothetical protein